MSAEAQDDGAVLGGERLRLAPLRPADVDALRAIRREPEVERWWDPVEDGFPMHDEPGTARRTVHLDGVVVGMVQWSEELEPKYRSAEIDVFLGAGARGRGVGRRVLRLVVDHLMGTRGHHRISIDPAADNEAAVRCYAAAGFVPVGRLRLAERDAEGHGWHDALLMELVVDPATREQLPSAGS